MTDTPKKPLVTKYRVEWTADHEQYFQGHGIASTDYTHCATGSGETLYEAFEDAFAQLCEQDLITTDRADALEAEMLSSLETQLEPSAIDTNIVEDYCEAQGEHSEEDPDCAVCAGEWYYYVSIDVKVEEDKETLQRDSDGTLPAYAWPGGYPIYYLAADNGVLCPKCANGYKHGRDTEEQLKPIASDINWEDPDMYCEHCNTRIESAYAEDRQGKGESD